MGRKPVLLLAVVAGLTVPPACGRADLHFPQPVADAGEKLTGPVLSHRFAFVNRGPDVVEITDTRGSCGCMKPHLEKRVLQPGEAGSLLMEINTLSQPPGPNSWRMQVRYRSGMAEAETAVELRAQLKTEITVSPAALTFFGDKAVSHTICLTDPRPQPLMITDVQCSSARLAVLMRESSISGPIGEGVSTNSLVVKVADDCPDGRHEEAVYLYTDDPAYRELKVPVTIVKRTKQQVVATPGEVHLSAPAGQAVPSRIVLIRPTGDRAVKVDHVTPDDPALVCTFAQGPNTMATVKVQVDRNRLRAVELQSAIHVQLSEPVRETLTIPVTVTVGPGSP